MTRPLPILGIPPTAHRPWSSQTGSNEGMGFMGWWREVVLLLLRAPSVPSLSGCPCPWPAKAQVQILTSQTCSKHKSCLRASSSPASNVRSQVPPPETAVRSQAPEDLGRSGLGKAEIHIQWGIGFPKGVAMLPDNERLGGAERGNLVSPPPIPQTLPYCPPHLLL